jgi:MFS transporter, MHS family, proline/betaine transporter
LNFLCRQYWQIAAQKEAAVFAASAKNKSSAQQPPRWPILSLWQNHRRELLLSTLLSALMGALYSSVFVYMFSFMQQFTSIKESSALVISALLLGLSCLLVPWFADFADRYGRRPIIRLGFSTLLLLTLPAMYCILHGGFLLVLFGVSLLVIAITLLIAAAAVTYCELFPETVRYSGAAVSYNVGMALLGSTSPLLIQAGIMWHGNVYIFAFYLLILSACGLFVSRMLPETTPKLNLSNLQKATDYATST